MDNKVESGFAWMEELYDRMKACIGEVNGFVQDFCWLKAAL